MVKEFSQLIHLMEQGFIPRNYGSGWKIQRPNRDTQVMEIVDVDRAAIAQAKRFNCIEIIEKESGQEAILPHSLPTEEDQDYPVPEVDLTLLSNEERLDALEQTGLLGSPPEECFDRITRMAAKVLGCKVALVTLVLVDRQYLKSIFGLTGRAAETRCTPLSESVCKYVVASGEELIVSDMVRHPLTKDVPMVEALNLHAYAGIPLWSIDKQALGAFCILDQKPRKWTPEELWMLREFAAMANSLMVPQDHAPVPKAS